MSITGEEDEPAEARGPGAPSAMVATLAALAAAFFYWVAQGSIAGLGQSDPAGNGMAAGFAVIAEFLLWLCLAAYLWAMCWRSRLHAPVLVPAAALALAAAIACLTAIGLMRQPTWLRIVPTVLPLLAILFGLWARVSRALGRRVRLGVSIGMGATALALIATAFIEQAKWDSAAPQRAAGAEAAMRASEREQAENLRRWHGELQALGPDDPLDSYLPFLDSEWTEEALAGIRQVRSRQGDAERLIRRGVDFYEIDRLHEFGLAASPSLCGAYRARVDRQLADFVPTNDTRGSIPTFLEGQIANFRWFIAEGCDVAPQVRRLREQVREFTPQHYAPSYGEQLDVILAEADS